MTDERPRRPAALVTGAGSTDRPSRPNIAASLADDGWDRSPCANWKPRRADGAAQPAAHDEQPNTLAADLRARGATVVLLPGDRHGPGGARPSSMAAAVAAFGPLRGIVLSHAESVDSAILDTTVESFDRHMIINARAAWQLIAAFATQARDGGAIVALTSDDTASNLPYGASKGALDRIVIAAARELGHLGIRSNAVNPGPVDTGWMNDEIRTRLAGDQPTGRLGTRPTSRDSSRSCSRTTGRGRPGSSIHTDGGFSS